MIIIKKISIKSIKYILSIYKIYREYLVSDVKITTIDNILKSLKFYLIQILFIINIIIPEGIKKLLKYLLPNVVCYILGAFDNNVMVGFAYLRICKRLCHKYYIGYIGSLGIAVINSYQQGGIGSQLLRELLNLAKEENVEYIYLYFDPKYNKIYNFYKKHGFNVTNEIDKRGYQKMIKRIVLN